MSFRPGDPLLLIHTSGTMRPGRIERPRVQPSGGVLSLSSTCRALRHYAFEMFEGILGIWAPFCLIFIGSLLGGRLGEW